MPNPVADSFALPYPPSLPVSSLSCTKLEDGVQVGLSFPGDNGVASRTANFTVTPDFKDRFASWLSTAVPRGLAESASNRAQQLDSIVAQVDSFKSAHFGG